MALHASDTIQKENGMGTSYIQLCSLKEAEFIEWNVCYSLIQNAVFISEKNLRILIKDKMVW